MKSNQRYLAQIDATFLSRSQNVPFLTDYVSREGIFVRTDSPPRVMELMRIELTLPPTASKIVLHGVVTRLVAPSATESAPGAEVAFFAKEGSVGRAWDEFLAFLDETHPESRTQSVKLGVNAVDQVRRATPRLDAAFSIRIESKGDETVTVDNISEGGMFIRTRDSYDVGASLRILVQHPRTFAMIAVECAVRRSVPGENAGIGVAFQNVTHIQRELLKELIEAASSGASLSAPKSTVERDGQRPSVLP